MKRLARALAGCLAVLLLGGLLAGGCGLRTPSGIRVDQRSVDIAADNPDIRKLPPGPAAGASPAALVNGFLEAAAADPDHGVAQEFLAPGAVWNERDAATVYQPESVSALKVTVKGSVSRVGLSVEGVGVLSSGGAFLPAQRELDVAFALRRIDGQWRLTRVPAGVLLTPRDLARVYRPVLAYGFNPGGSLLVPEPGYVVSDRAGLAGAALHALLTGWGSAGGSTLDAPGLAPGLTSLGSVVVRDGEATVDLGREAFTVSPPRRPLLVSQIAASLASVPGVFTVQVLVEERPYIGGFVAAELAPALAAGSVGPALAIGPDGGLVSLTGTTFARVRWIARRGARAGAVPTPPGSLSDPVARPGGRELTVLQLTSQGPQLIVADVAGSAPPTATERIVTRLRSAGAGSYLPPQWLDASRLLLAIGGSTAHLQVLNAANATVHPVSAPGLAALGPLSALAVSRDGTRVIAVAGPAGARRAYLGRLLPASDPTYAVTAEGWTPLPTSLVDVATAGWSGDLSVTLVGTGAGASPGAFTRRGEVVSLDTVSDPTPLPALPPELSAATALSDALKVATAPGRPTILSGNGARWMLTGSRWVPVSAAREASYP